MHSSRMRTTHLLTVSHSIRWEEMFLQHRPPPPTDARAPWIQTPLVMCPVMHAGKPTLPPVGRQTPVKTLSCPKVRQRAVIINRTLLIWTLMLTNCKEFLLTLYIFLILRINNCYMNLVCNMAPNLIEITNLRLITGDPTRKALTSD